PRGIPRSVFLGRPVKDGEALWSDQDRIDALVWQAEEDEKLPCGHDRATALDPDNEDAFEVRRIQCHACKAIHDDVSKLEDVASTRFMFFIPQLEVNDG